MVKSRSFCCLFMILSLATIKVRAQPQTDVEVRRTAHKAVKTVMPDYPEQLKKQGIGGQLFLLVDIDRKGNMDDVGIWIGRHPELDRLAVEALRNWTSAMNTAGSSQLLPFTTFALRRCVR